MTDRQHILTAAIITYNHQDTIARCIESVLSQKTSYPFKIQIWDDCSTDGTSEICAEYAKRYPNKIIHVLQPENSYMRPLDRSSLYRNWEKVATKYVYFIDGDDYLIDNGFFQIGIDYLQRHENCSIFGARIRCNNELNHCTYDLPDMSSAEFTITIDDVGTKRFKFVHSQTRIYRNIESNRSAPYDFMAYLYYLTQGYCNCINKVVAVYNITGKGVWSVLDGNMQYRINQSLYYRMMQYYGWKYEKIWLRGLCRKERRKIQLLKLLLGTKRAWEFWFKQFMVPTFGVESLDRNWNYLSFTWNSRSA